MFAKLIAPVLAAAAFVSAADDAACTSESGFTINSAADFSAYSGCTTLGGDVTIGTATDATIDLSGPTKIDGKLTLINNGAIVSLASTSLESISGEFNLNNVTILSTLSMPSLTSVGSISWISLPALTQLTFTQSISTASSVIISDTFLQSLDGIDLDTVGEMNINNNRRLTTFTTSLKSLSDNLNIQANGKDLAVSMPNLIWIANMTIANTTEFSAPSLEVVNGSMKFDSNYFTSFAAPNMTSTLAGDISFINNVALTNISFPSLTAVGGALTIVNDTALEEINQFPLLKTVGGAVKLGGNFSDVAFPALSDVKGTFEISSTGDISDSCTTLKKLAPGSSGGSGVIQGSFTCTSNNAQANTGSTDGSSSTGSSSSTNSSSAAINVHVSSAALGLTFMGFLAQLL